MKTYDPCVLMNESTLGDFTPLRQDFKPRIFFQVQLLQPCVLCDSSEEILPARRGWDGFCYTNFPDLHHRRKLQYLLRGQPRVSAWRRELQPPSGGYDCHCQQKGDDGHNPSNPTSPEVTSVANCNLHSWNFINLISCTFGISLTLTLNGVLGY